MRSRVLVVVLLVLTLLGVAAPPSWAASDTTPPVLHSVSLAAPGPFTAGDAVTVNWDATDDVGVSQVQVNLRDAAGKDHTVWANAPASSGSTTIDSSWADGPVTVTYVWVYDVDGNFAVYYRDGTLATSPSTQTTHTVDLAAADFSTQGTGADLTPPTLSAVGLAAPGPFTAGDTVSIDVTATDDSGVRFLNLGFRDAAGKTHSVQASGNPSTVSTVIDASWADGPVHLYQVEVQDNAFNTSVYKDDGSVTYSAGTTGPATHSVDFSQADFSTYDTGADVTPPQLSSLVLSTPGPLVEGDAVTYSFSASDASGVSQVAVVLVDAANKSHTLFALNGASTASATIDASWAIGTVHVESVRVYDTMANEADYYANGTVTYTPPGSGTHSLDFAAQSFEVQGRPSVAMTSTPPASSRSTSATFAFASADRDTPLQDLSATCTLDAYARPCTPSGASFAALADGSHRLDVTVSDPQGHRGVASYAWSIDATSPLVQAAAFAGPVTLSGYLPLRWSATDSGSGVASYDVRYQVGTAAAGFTGWYYPTAWQHVTVTSVTSPALGPGQSLCFAVRARDRVGNTSAWTVSRCVSRAYDDPSLRRSSGWYGVVLSSLYGGSALQTTRYGATVSTATVTVRRVALVATTCPTCGSVGVYVGGQLVGRLSLVSSTLRHRVVLALPLFAARTGGVVVKVLTAGRPVEVDGLAVSRV